MIYAAKPQRGGKSIPSNINNPPQDPPPTLISNEVFIPIENTAPPVPEIEPIIKETTKPVIETKEISKLSVWRKIVKRIKKIWKNYG